VSQPLIFVHLVKTAGNSLGQWLYSHLRSGEHLWVQNAAATRTVLVPGQGPINGLKLVWGHMPVGLHGVLVGSPRYLTIVRDPLERVLSEYEYTQVSKAPDDTVVAQIRGADLSRWFDEAWYGSLEPGTATWQWGRAHNHMTRMLAAGPLLEQYGPITERVPGVRLAEPGCLPRLTMLDYERAIANLQRFFWIGRFEQLQQDAEVLATRLGWKSEPLPWLNRRSRQRQVVDLDADLHRRIAEGNQWDLRLYRWVVEHADRINGRAPGGTCDWKDHES